MPSSRFRLVCLAGLCAALAACASDRPPERHGPPGGRWRGQDGEGPGGGQRGGPRGGPGGGASLFISPAGEPFRAGPGDAYPVARWFAGADADHDGKLTRQEFRADAERFFHQIDLNHDGVIEGPEITAYEHNVAPEILAGFDRQELAGPAPDPSQGGQGGGGRHGGGGRGGMGGMGGRHGGMGGGGGGGQSRQAAAGLMLQGAARFSLFATAEPVSAADSDFDGKVTLAEFLEAANRHFAELDAAGSGALTLQSLPETPVQRMADRHRRRQATGGG